MIPNWQAMPYPPHDAISIAKCARCGKVFGRLEAAYSLGGDYFHPECWDNREEKPMDDQRKFYVVRLGNGYVQRYRYTEGGPGNWKSIEAGLTVNSIDAQRHDTEESAQKMVDVIGGEVCCFGIYDAKTTTKDPINSFSPGTLVPAHGFDWALQQMMSFRRVRRTGWSEEGTWLAIQTPDADDSKDLPFIYTRLSTGSHIPFGPTQEDMLQRDWILETG